MDTMQDQTDQTFRAEAEKANLKITSLSGDAVQKDHGQLRQHATRDLEKDRGHAEG